MSLPGFDLEANDEDDDDPDVVEDPLNQIQLQVNYSEQLLL